MTQHSQSDNKMTRVYSWFTALISNDTVLMSDLLAHGLPVDVLHPLRHSTALMEAARLGRTDMVEWLLAHDADPDQMSGQPKGTALHAALRRQHYSAAHLLINAMGHSAAMDEHGATPLHTICIDLPEGCTQTAQMLAEACIAKGCPLDALDHEGATALHYCVINDALEMADMRYPQGRTPMPPPRTGASAP